jgi:mono/diheme cytochrome c family protein
MTRHGAAIAIVLPGLLALVAACATSGGAPPETVGGSDRVTADADVQAALTRSCYGCHAESGQLPWQAKLAPSAWFAGAAREKLDFSTFHALSADRRNDALRAIQRVVSSGEMPPWDSVLFDGTEKLTPAEKDRVASWASEAELGATR